MLFDRTERGLLARWWWTVDRPLLGMFALLALSGLIMVLASSPPVATRLGLSSWHFVVRHLVYLAPAALLLIGCSLLSPRGVYRVAVGLLGLSIAMLLATLVIGVETHGASRWISFGYFAIQPGEFAKPAMAVVAAAILAKAPGVDRFLPVLVLAGLIIALLLAQPDVGMALIVASVTAIQLFIAGLPWLLVAGGLALGVFALWQAYSWFPHVAGRFDRFFDPAAGDNYQVGLALKAVKSAAWFGSGPGEGKLKTKIPDAHSDFIFAVAAEEFGLIACLVLLGMFAFVVLRGLRRTETITNRFVLISGGGLLALFCLQTMVNLGVNLSVLPATGMTLPFISYGGSALCATAIGMGMFLALTRRRFEHEAPP
ncbi:MAG: FtsW/RodA/SpoVE family cell cycle protein [Geminicoccales bacterium]